MPVLAMTMSEEHCGASRTVRSNHPLDELEPHGHDAGRTLNKVSPEYERVAMIVFSSTFGGSEAAAILEAEIAEE